MSRFALPRSLLARNIALLVALVALSQVCALTVLMHFVQRPRIERAALVFSDYLRILDSTLAPLPAAEGAAIAAQLDGHPGAPPDLAPEPAPSLIGFFRTYQRDVFMEALRRHMPAGMDALWQMRQNDDGAGEKLWVRVHIAGAPWWLALPINDDGEANGITTALALSLGLSLMAALTGYAIQRHINRPLRDLARAARHVSAGEAPVPLPTDGPTEIAEVSSAFNQMTDALKAAEATRALMLAGVSHDIRTPLTKLRLAMAMAGPSGRDGGFVASAEGYLDHIDTILQQFMDYAGSGEREPPQPGDLNALVNQLAADFAGLGHDFEVDTGDVPVFAYRPIAMLRLLMNLMQNAILYGKTGLAVRTWRDADNVHIAVGDRGKTITPEALERLKAPFSRGSNARTQSGGTGLGLAIVERIARLHGGTLQFRAREGGGLEVLVTLPLARGSRMTSGDITDR